jgi:hypothetical protein
MSLSTILEKINEQKVIAEQDLNAVNPLVLSYKKGQVNSAKTKLEDLYVDYKNELLKNSVFILVTGDQSAEFASVAEEKFKCFSVDAKSMFKDILKQLSPDLYKNKKINASVFGVLGNLLEDRMKHLDVGSYNQLLFNTKYSKIVKNEEEMLNVIADSVCDIIGSEVVGLEALEQVTKKAVNKNYKSRIVPIILYDNDENFVSFISEGLRKINPRVIKVGAGELKTELKTKIKLEEVNEKTIEEALKTIAAQA